MEQRYWKIYSREQGLTGFGEYSCFSYEDAVKSVEETLARMKKQGSIVSDYPAREGEYRCWYVRQTHTIKNQYFYSIIPLIKIEEMPEEARPEDWRADNV